MTEAGVVWSGMVWIGVVQAEVILAAWVTSTSVHSGRNDNLLTGTAH